MSAAICPGSIHIPLQSIACRRSLQRVIALEVPAALEFQIVTCIH